MPGGYDFERYLQNCNVTCKDERNDLQPKYIHKLECINYSVDELFSVSMAVLVINLSVYLFTILICIFTLYTVLYSRTNSSGKKCALNKLV